MQVCLTAGAGYGMAPGELSLATAVLATLGTAMASAAANTINQILEVPFDSQMGRTKVLTLFIHCYGVTILSPPQNRVLVRGQVSTLHAYTFAAVLATSSTTLLWHLVCPLTATLSLANLVLYTSVYTPMKRCRTYRVPQFRHQCFWICSSDHYYNPGVALQHIVLSIS